MFKRRLTLIQALQFFVFYVTIDKFLPMPMPYFVGQYIFMMLIFSFFSRRKGFVFLIFYTLILGIVFLLAGFIYSWAAARQIEAIISHLTLVINSSIAYTSSYLSRRLEQENSSLLQRVNELEEYVGYSRLLTRQEFLKRSNIIKAAMTRRDEEGYLLIFSLEALDPNVQKTAFESLTSIAIAAFRKEYDLIGQWEQHAFVVLLQNTGKEGLQIALNRYLSSVRAKMNICTEDIVIRTESIKPRNEELDMEAVP